MPIMTVVLVAFVDAKFSTFFVSSLEFKQPESIYSPVKAK